MHKLQQLIKQVNRTHKGLGPLIAVNILTAKAKKTILNVAPAGCGKSVSSDSSAKILQERSRRYTSMTLAGLMRVAKEFTEFDGHIVIDDLGAEKSLWSRISTITVLANLVYGHHIHKITHSYDFTINDFRGSVSMNIQPVLLNSLVQDDEWVSVVRDKVIRYYHLIRPTKPKPQPPDINFSWGIPLQDVGLAKYKGKLWYQLVAIGLTQWSYARVQEHLPDLLRACSALDDRRKVNITDYKLLIKLLQPLQLERYLVATYGFEQGRVFDNNLYCLLVEFASFGEPSLMQICEDYKVSPSTSESLIATVPQWCYIKTNSPKHIVPTDKCKEILNLCGANQKW